MLQAVLSELFVQQLGPLKATSQFLDPWTGKLAKSTNKALNNISQFKPISDRSIQQAGQFANNGLNFLKPWMFRFRAK